jgi:hypothetical protein
MVLPPRRTAVVLPTVANQFYPGSPAWETFVMHLRSKADVLALTPFGPMSEPMVAVHPELTAPAEPDDRRLAQEARVRIRTWLSTMGYEKVILLAFGPMMRHWTDAAIGHPAALRTKILPVRKSRLWDSVLRRDLYKAVGIDMSQPSGAKEGGETIAEVA